MDRKPDELAMMQYVLTHQPSCPQRSVLGGYPMNPKRKKFILAKWVGKGWFEWGTCETGGCVTVEGLQAFQDILPTSTSCSSP
ncbi:MAG: hypothetical protein R3B45_07695 [Bdellovibrionota bacterium]